VAGQPRAAALAGRLGVALHRQRDDPERPRRQALAQHPHLDVRRLERHARLRAGDRLLLGDADLRLLAAPGRDEGEREQAEDDADAELVATGRVPDLIAPFSLERFYEDKLVSELAAAAVSH
jgi:hypothetical protein